MNTIKVNNISELKQRKGTENTLVSVLGYYTPEDNGGGEFYWDSNSTETDNGGTVISVTSIVTGRWKRVFQNEINVKWFGAKGDNATDDTIFIQKAHSVEKNIIYPKGNTFIVSEEISLFSNCSYTGGGTIKRTSDTKNIFKILGTNENKKTNILVENLTFRGVTTSSSNVNGDYSPAAIDAIYINNLKINNCSFISINIVNTSLINTTQHLVDDNRSLYSSVSDTNCNKNVIITNNVCEEVTKWIGTTHNHAIKLIYTNKFTISNNIFKNIDASVVIIGGFFTSVNSITSDSSFKGGDGVINSNVITDGAVGIWSWTAKNIIVSNNSINNISNECFDNESCSNILYEGNNLTNIKGQCFASFYNNKNIQINNNVCELDYSTSIAAPVYQSNCTIDNESIYVRNNKFVCKSGIGRLVMSSCRNIIFDNNYFYNIAINFTGFSNNINLLKNEIILSELGTSPNIDYAISFSSDILKETNPIIKIIENNIHTPNNVLVSGLTGVVLRQSNIEAKIYIKNNDIRGVAYAFDIKNFNSFATKLHIIEFSDNTISASSSQKVIVQPESATNAEVYLIWKNNKNIEGMDLFGTLPPTYSSIFKNGSIIYNNTPTTGSYIGWVCTVSSTNPTNIGTWKTFGLIS